MKSNLTRPMKAALAALLAGAALCASAATMVINNVDAPGVGFNDKTPATPVGGNPGVTVGEQRLYAFRYAMDLWGARVQSNVPIVVQGSFAPLACTATGGVLGSAGALQIFANFPGAQRPDTWYGAALANSMAGVDLTPGKPDPGLLAPPFNDDIVARFNGRLGQPGCLEGNAWYYGLDNRTPAGMTDFLNVFMHELAHGLGFQNFISEADGLPPAFPDFPHPDIYMRMTKDTTLGRTWDQLTPEEIVASAVRDTRIVWNGPNVTAAVPSTLEPYSRLVSTLPAGYARDFNFAGYGPAARVGAFGGPVVLVNDGVGAGNGPFDGCEPIPAGQVTGRIALIIRGTCTFATKSLNAQLAGATGVIIFNNVAAGFPGLGGGDPRITIPTIGLTFADGLALFNGGNTGTVGLVADPTQPRFGADAAGNALLYAPTVVALGSSISHFDIRAFPNLLMEPAITGTLQAATNVDLTPLLFADIGWTTTDPAAGPYVLFGCKTDLPQSLPGYGALQDGVFACSATNPATHGQFVSCVSQLANSLNAAGLISGAQAATLKSCAAKRP
jgi:PA domain